jgi:hypothetical protein
MASEPSKPPQALVFGQDVTLQTHWKDQYGRILAEVLLPHATNVNHDWLKRAGAGGIGSMRLVIASLRN